MKNKDIDIKLIVETIDRYLEQNNLNEITAVEANQVLEKEGVLPDNESRPGKPLRELLRAELIPNAEYRIKFGNKRGNWFIHRSRS